MNQPLAPVRATCALGRKGGGGCDGWGRGERLAGWQREGGGMATHVHQSRNDSNITHVSFTQHARIVHASSTQH